MRQLTDNSGKTDIKPGLANKYLMACVISRRARFLSEKKGRNLEEGINNPIFLAMQEIEQGKLEFKVRVATASEKTDEGVIPSDAGMEEKP